MTPEVFQEAIRELQKRAASDEQFRELAKTDSLAALAQLGLQLPANAKVKFVEPEDGITISLLPKANSEGELSDDELENASGGNFLTFTGIIFVC